MGTTADLPGLLTLLHESRQRWRTLAAEGEEWQDAQGSFEAFNRLRQPGDVVSSRGASGPPERNPPWRLWVHQPDRSRAEFGMGHGLSVTTVTDADRTWTIHPVAGSQVHQRRPQEDAGPWLGPATVLVDTRGIPAAFDLEASGTAEVLGRTCVVARGRPASRRRFGPGVHSLLGGADEVRLAVDAERGVLLRVEAFLGGVPFYRVAMTAVTFDEPLADDLFALPAADGSDPSRPPRRPPLMRHGGPPDDVIGVPTNLHVELVRTPTVVAVMERVVAYPEGFELYVTVRTRDEPVAGTVEPGHPRSWGGTAAFPGESLRFGVEFSDGRRSFPGTFAQSSGPPDLTLMPLSGSGTGARFDQRFWVQPLPPPGPVGLIVEWERRGVPETRRDIPAEDILEAASRSGPTWPE
ncbi:MAG: LolA family protein [Acidimicrobiales bacterium]